MAKDEQGRTGQDEQDRTGRAESAKQQPPDEGSDLSEGAADAEATTAEEGETPPAENGETPPEKEGETPGAEPPASGKPPRSRKRRVLRWTAIGAAVLLVAGGGTAYALYRDLRGDINQEDVRDRLGQDRPSKLNKSLNILLLGSDTRSGDNDEYGSEATMPGARSDTTILLHLSPNRDRAVAISFPRDSMVHMPACKQKKAPTVPAQFGMLNAAFALGGPTCTWKTIESLTDIHIDHYVQIDFSGFKRVVDALGGVEMCVPQDVNDPRAELHLKAGRQKLDGDEALGYVRARYTLGNGSDLDRIERQQRFMGAVVKKATSTELLANPAKTYKFLKAATKSVSTDDDLTLSTIRKLASSVKGMSAGKVRFVTVPVEGYAPDPNRVQWNMKAAEPLFDAIRADDELPAAPAPSAGPQQAPPAPSTVSVKVIDASGKKGGKAPGKRAAAELARRGFKVDAKVGRQAKTAANQLRYGPSGERQAGALATLLPGAVLTPDSSITDGTVVLVLGSGGYRLAPPSIADVGGISAKGSACKSD